MTHEFAPGDVVALAESYTTRAVHSAAWTVLPAGRRFEVIDRSAHDAVVGGVHVATYDCREIGVDPGPVWELPAPLLRLVARDTDAA